MSRSWSTGKKRKPPESPEEALDRIEASKKRLKKLVRRGKRSLNRIRKLNQRERDIIEDCLD